MIIPNSLMSDPVWLNGINEYPDYPKNQINRKENTIYINHSERYKFIQFELRHTTTIKDRGHARAIRRKTKFKDINVGDVFYKNLFWKDISGFSKLIIPAGFAIERKGEIIYYNMPGVPNGYAHRTVLFEKFILGILLKS